MQLAIYNSLTNKLEPFVPLDADGRSVTFYACGPTVYDYAHIGNFRSFLNADVMRRTLEFLGYEVRQVMNITDVGHMTEDDVADGGGADKMEAAVERLNAAKKSGKLPPGVDIDPNDPFAISDFYAEAFIEDGRTLGMEIVDDYDKDPACMPRPTRYVPQMIKLIEQLIEKEHAYLASDGVVYFDVQSYPAYGALSGNTPDTIRSGEGGRVDEGTQAVKRHPADFMLWKPDNKHLMKWPSPWGEGYPGWHLECSVMAIELLGQETNGVIDLHSGGEDNIFPHHECEIAQSCCASGSEHFARFWFHTRFLIVEGEKMSKSKGNFHTVRDVVAKGASPAALRLELIKTNYRKNANFTFLGLKDSQRQIDRWKRLETWLDAHADKPLPCAGPLQAAIEPFGRALCEDLGIGAAIGVLNQAMDAYALDNDDALQPGADTSGTYADELAALRKMDHVIGVLNLTTETSAGSGIDVDKIDALINERTDARANKDWAASDRIRDELQDMGIAIKDGADGTTWSRIIS